jgi:hypothetical protein
MLASEEIFEGVGNLIELFGFHERIIRVSGYESESLAASMIS